MKNIYNFIKLDFMTIKAYTKNILIMLIFPFIFLFLDWEVNISAGVLFGYTLVISSYPFSISENNNMDTLFLSLPIDRAKIVTSRYLFSFILLIVDLFVTIIMFLVDHFFLSGTTVLSEAIFMSSIFFVLFSVLLSCQLFVFFKLGYLGAKFLNFILPFGIFILVGLGSTALGRVFRFDGFFEAVEKLLSNPALFFVSTMIISIFSLFISCKFSQKVYLKRDL